MASNRVTMQTSDVWQNLRTEADLPEGFTYRGTLPTDPNGVELMLEGWDAGTSEPPHCHPGDDMTVMSQGEMHVQFYVVENDKLVKDGPMEIYKQGETAYIRKGQIHSVNYVNTCKLVYVHNGAFDFIESELPMADDA